MFEKYINKYFELIAEEFSDKESIDLKDIFTSELIPSPIKAYIENETKLAVNFTRNIIDDSPIFSSKEPEIESSLNKLEGSLKESMYLNKISFDEFLKNVIEIRYNFILRPRFTLEQLNFSDSVQNESISLKRTFSYFLDYRYLKDGFLEQLEKEPVILMEKDEFSAILSKIDNQYIYNLNSEEFIEFLNPIFTLFTFDGLDKAQNKVPIEALMIFFDEKGISPLLNKLSELVNSFDTEFLTLEEFKEIIDELDTGEETQNSNIENNADQHTESTDLNSEEYFDNELENFSKKINEEIEIEDQEIVSPDSHIDYDKDLNNFDMSEFENEDEIQPESNQTDKIDNEVDKTNQSEINNETFESTNYLDEDIKEFEDLFPGEDVEIKAQKFEGKPNKLQEDIEKLYTDI